MRAVRRQATKHDAGGAPHRAVDTPTGWTGTASCAYGTSTAGLLEWLRCTTGPLKLRRRVSPNRTVSNLDGPAPAGDGPSSVPSATIPVMDLIASFIETVEDLRVRSSLTSTSYDAIQASGLIRRLLMDGGAVGDRAVRELGDRGWIDAVPVAEWGTGSVLRSSDRGLVWVATHTLDPTLLEPSFNLRKNPDALKPWIERGSPGNLLKARVLLPNEHESLPAVNAHSLVKHFAIALGGVHHGDKTRAPVPELLARAIDGAMPDLLWVLRALGRIIVRAYEPLVCSAIINGRMIEPSRWAASSRRTVEPSPSS